MKSKPAQAFKSFIEKKDYYPPKCFESKGGPVVIDNGVNLGSFNNFDENGDPIFINPYKKVKITNSVLDQTNRYIWNNETFSWVKKSESKPKKVVRKIV
jgi:hypothetical protein